MSGTIGVVLERPSGRDRESGLPLAGDMGRVLVDTFAFYGVDVRRDCPIAYVVPAYGVHGASMDLVRPNQGRVQAEMAGVDKILCCGPLAVAAAYPWHCVPTKYHKFRGRGGLTSWGTPPKFVLPTYSVQQVWREPNYFRDLAFDVQKLVSLDAPQPRPDVEVIVIGRDEKWDDPRDELAHWLARISGASIVACDLETRGFDPHKDRIISIGFGVMLADDPRRGKAIIVPEGLLYPQSPYVCGLLARFFGERSGFKGALVFQNMQFDLRFLRAYLDGWHLHPGLADTLLLNYALDERPIGKYGVHSLKDMARYRFDAEDFAWDWKAWGPKPAEEQAAELEALYAYNGIDCFYTAKIYEVLTAEMETEDPALASLVRDLLIPGAKAIAKVVHAGVLVDQGYLREYRAKLVKDIAIQRAAAVAYAEGLGVPDFNPASPQQVSRLLFDVLGLPVPPKGQKKTSDRDDDAFSFDRERQDEADSSTSKDVLDRVRKGATEGQRAFIDDILLYRLYAKTLGTYVDGLLGGRMLPDGTLSAPKISVDGRVHPDLIIAGTATGRLAANSPNLQNIPLHTGAFIRKAFIAPPGYTLLEFDYQALELRMIAWYSGEPALVEAFRAGLDVHRATAARFFGKPMEQVSDHERFLAKALNFGCIYGRSAEAIAEGRENDLIERETGTRWSVEQAREFHDAFLSSMPVLLAWMDTQVKAAFAAHKTVTPFGRTRRFPLVHYHRRGEIERRIVNTLVQSCASDICFSALIRLVDALPEGCRVVLTVHDSLLLECRDDLVPRMIPFVADIMGRPPLEDRNVPWAVECKRGKNWAEMEKIDV